MTKLTAFDLSKHQNLLRLVRWFAMLLSLQAISLHAQTSYNVRTLVGEGITSYVPKLPYGIAIEPSGNVVFADGAQVMRLDLQTRIVSIVAGTGEEGFSGDGGPAQLAKLRSVYDIATDSNGNIYIADAQDHRIRRIDGGTGVISTLAGIGVAGFSGDGGAATAAQLRYPRGIGYDPAGALLVADTENNRLRRVDLSTGVITTLVGGGQQSSGAPNQVYLCSPLDAAVAPNGDVFISDLNCGSVLRFAQSDGQVSSYVNQSRQQSFYNDATFGVPAQSFRLTTPYALEFDADGNLLIADARLGSILRVDRDTTIISRVAGTGSYTDAPDLTAAVNRRVVSSGIVRAPSGVLYTSGYFSGTGLSRIEQLTPLGLGDATQILVTPNSGGSLAFVPQGVPCGTNCWQYPFGSAVTITARPSALSSFSSWSGGCTGSQLTCVVSPGVTRPVAAYFNSPANVKLERIGTGSGSIRTNPQTIDCRDSCVVGFFYGTSVQFIATPAADSRFVAWEGECAGVTETTCTRTINQNVPARDIVARARFELLAAKLVIEFFGTGTGKVDVIRRSTILKSCTATCVVEANGGDVLSLMADGGPLFVENPSAFSGWRSCSAGSPTVYDGSSITAGVTTCIGVGFYVSRNSNTNRISFSGLVALDGSLISEVYGALWTSPDGNLLVGQKPFQGPYSFTALKTPGVGYRPIWHLDLNRDVRNEVIFQKVDQTDGFGPVSAWLISGSTQLTSVRNVGLNWQVQAAGDLDGDGFGDLVWRYVLPDSNDTGVSYIWFMRNGQVEQVRKRGGAPLNWVLVGALDVNRDGADDMFYVSPTGDIRILIATAGRTCANFSGGRIPTGFMPVAVGRFSQLLEGAELLVRNPTTGELGAVQITGFGVDLPPATARPDDPNAACTPTLVALKSTFKSFPLSGTDWTYLGRDRPFSLQGSGQDVILFARPDRRIMMLQDIEQSGGSGAGPSRFVDVGEMPQGYRMVNK